MSVLRKTHPKLSEPRCRTIHTSETRGTRAAMNAEVIAIVASRSFAHLAPSMRPEMRVRATAKAAAPVSPSRRGVRRPVRVRVRALRTSARSEEHTSELQSRGHLVCRLLLEKKKHITRFKNGQ